MCDRPCPCEKCTRRRYARWNPRQASSTSCRFEELLDEFNNDYGIIKDYRSEAGRTGELTMERYGMAQNVERNVTNICTAKELEQINGGQPIDRDETIFLLNERTQMNAPPARSRLPRDFPLLDDTDYPIQQQYETNLRPVNQPPVHVYRTEVRSTSQQGWEDSIPRLKNKHNPTKKENFGVGAEAGFAYFLSETIGIIGFCVITTFCLWALMMKLGLQFLSKINNSDKRFRNGLLLLILIVSLVIFQGILLRKVKNLTHVKKSAVKLKPQKSKIVVAKSTDTKGYWYSLKDGVAGVWMNFKNRVSKAKVRVTESWHSQWRSKNINATVTTSTSSSTTTLKTRRSFLSVSKEATSSVKTTVSGLLRWPFEKRSPPELPQKPNPSFWSSYKATVYNMPATVMSTFRRSNSSTSLSSSYSSCSKEDVRKSNLWNWPFRGNNSSSSTSVCSCQNKSVSHWNLKLKFWADWKASSLKTSGLDVFHQIKDFFTAPPPEENDPVAREVMRQSKLYAIPMEMKRPPQILVSLRDYFQR